MVYIIIKNQKVAMVEKKKTLGKCDIPTFRQISKTCLSRIMS